MISTILLSLGCSYTQKLVKTETEAALAKIDTSALSDLVLPNELDRLPSPVQHYLLNAGVVGRPRTKMFQAHFEGRMKMGGETDSWRKVEGHQSSFMDSSYTRIFYIKTRMFGIVPVVGRDKYDNGQGNMRIRVMDKFTVVNTLSETMDKSALVTFLNDLMFFPSAMLSPKVKWEAVSDSSAKATLTDCGKSVSGIFFFNSDHDIVNFVTDDRTYDNGRGDVRKARWWTPMRKHATFKGIRVPVEGGAEWDFGDRRFFYADFKFRDIAYDAFKLIPQR